MSRAFVNEDQAAAQADQPVERRVSEQPNYVTANGLHLLQTRVAGLNALRSELQAQGERGDKQRLADTERDLRYFSARVQSARWCRQPLHAARCRLVAAYGLSMRRTRSRWCSW